MGRKTALQLLRAWKRQHHSYGILERFREWTAEDFSEGIVLNLPYCKQIW